MLNSFKKKILGGFLLITILCVISLTTVSLLEARKIATIQMKNDGIAISSIVRRSLSKNKITDTKEISKILKGIKNDTKEDMVYLSVCDENFKVVAHNDDNMLNTDIDDKEKFENVLKDGKTIGLIFKRITGDKVYNVSTPFYEDGKVVGIINVGISIESMNDLIKKGLIETLSISLLILIISFVIASLIARNISKPIESMVSKMDRVSKGDFTVEFHAKGKDEISKLMGSLNKTMESIRKLISNIKDEVTTIDGVSQNLSASSEENAASTTQVSNSVAEVAESSTNQAQQINEATEALMKFGKILDAVNNKVIDVANSSSNIKDSAHDGSIKIDKLVKSVEDIKEIFLSITDRISSLNGSVIKISEITDVINEIAEKTNLLALNAAIEAARAGESGKGFSVVAEEIRKLAEQVLYSSKNIHTLVESVTNNTCEVSNTTEKVSEKIQVQADSIEDTMSSFKNILGEVEKVTFQVEEVSKKLNMTMDEKGTILSNVETVSNLSQELSASTEEIASAMEQQASSTEEVSFSAEELTELADRLATLVQNLKIE
ncbi:methyl-accepting chemotaxis protein [Clostridium sp. FAM 1755]|uniref:methyl-accepting chemotaxis protein n=1 Tax=Clostridium caseinilyticum TaxID=3350403 RepID=UPI0038F6A1FB